MQFLFLCMCVFIGKRAPAWCCIQPLLCLSPLSSGLCADELQQMGCAERQWGFVLLHWNSWRIKSHPKLSEPTHAFFLFSVDPGFSCHVHLLPAQKGDISLPMCSHTRGYLEQVCCVRLRAQATHVVSVRNMLFLLWGLFRLSVYNIMSWKRKEICVLWRNSSSFSSVSLQCDTSLFTFFLIHLFPPPSSCSNLSGS